MSSPVPNATAITRERLVAILDRLQAAGTWSSEQVATLLAEIDAGGRPATAPARSASRRGRLAEAAGYAGAVLVTTAGVLLVRQQLADLGRAGRVAVLAGVTVLLVAAGAVVAALPPRGRRALLLPAGAVRRRSASTALTVAAATAAGTAAVAVPGHAALAAGLVGVVAATAATWVAASALSEAAALGAVLLVAGAVLTEAESGVLAGVLTMAAVGAGWVALSATRLLTLPLLALALGLVVVLYSGIVGAYAGEQPAKGVGIAVLGVLAVVGLAGYVRSGRWPWAAAGTLALAALALRISSELLGPVLALLLTGLVLLGAGAVLLLRGGRSGA